MARRDAALRPATCGVSTTCSMWRNGVSGSGSTSNTSSAAPAICFSSRASDQCRLVDQPASRGVDQDGRGLHQGQPPRVDQMPGLGGERRVDGDEVGPRQQLVELDHAVAEAGHRVGLGHRVGHQHLHVEAEAPLGHRPPATAETDDPGGHLVQPAVQLAAPDAVAHAAGHTRRAGGPPPASAPWHDRRPRRGSCRRPWPRQRRAGVAAATST